MVTEEKRRLGGNVQQSRSSNEETSMVVSHSKHHEFSVGFVETHMSLPVPLHVTPSFDTDMVVLKWRLHFEFVTSVKPIDWGSKAETETHWQPPQKADIETMVWDFPVVIYPTAPAHISKAFHTQRDAAITVWLLSNCFIDCWFCVHNTMIGLDYNGILKVSMMSWTKLS